MNKNAPEEHSESASSEQMNAAKIDTVSGIVAGVSHEINTPLGVNIGNCTLLIELLNEISEKYKSGSLDAESFTEFLATATDLSSSMLKNMRRASKLLSTFKQVAVKNADEATLLEPVDIAELVNEFAAAYSGNGEASAISFNVMIPPGAVVVSYPAVIIQILTALTSNTLAHGFGLAAKSHCEITISLAPAGDGYQLTFADDGVGVSSDILNKVFDPFFTTRRGAGNAGLGLSIVHNLVKQMLQSDVYFDSQPDKGFSVAFKLHNLARSEGAQS
ncbi:sensor histidine kinase [Alteromonas lipolytica]|uniref:histidine kinase n=1 Tax=Alteromonas lipolytica TaxID=1856405 RepID=A0A1E8FG23_9ALTE|nr:HAMP domain-containing sensor histidine kinase [Alteromonas lipolytica]OFI34907.1 hypothetical protein BFC17_15175 [Alteromonas lipolytica]GGF54983.1 hypothetical protein GCM10011338_04020 [Alteromonas lipolytica]